MEKCEFTNKRNSKRKILFTIQQIKQKNFLIPLSDMNQV